MKIKKTIDVELSIEDLEKIIKEHLKKQNIKVDSITFDVNGHEDETDWRAEFPLTYKLDKVICSGEITDDDNVPESEDKPIKMVHIKTNEDTYISKIKEDFSVETKDSSFISFKEKELVFTKGLVELLSIEDQLNYFNKFKSVHVYMYSTTEPYTHEDWKISHDTEGRFDWKVSKGKFRCPRKYYKVIATTDTSLGLPLISEKELDLYMINQNAK